MNKKYTPVSIRVRAAIVDAIVFVVLMYSISLILSNFDYVSGFVRAGLFLLIFLFYEPILVSLNGATVGHFFNDIVVKREEDESRNITFLNAFKRVIIKFLLGWVSLITVNLDDKKRAIHDHAAKSIVKPYSKKLN